MDTVDLNEQIGRLSLDGVIINEQASRKEGIIPFLWKLADIEHLPFPGRKRDSFRKLAEELHQLSEQWQTDYPPLFAVTGLKNAGKSSLVKTFLSPEGRSRTPTGVEAKYATRRYVFWVPESIATSGQAASFESMLKDVFGNEPEALSLDPEIAKQQYREDLGFEGMKCPLIAYDSNLNSWNTGIVDCPDIETGDGKDDTKLSSAREMLEKASRLCAAFVVIGQHDNLERDVFWQIVRMVREVGQKEDDFLVVNKCPPKPASVICNEIANLSNHNDIELGDTRLFASYDFKTRGVEKFCLSVIDGALPEGSAVGDDDFDTLDLLLPTFFRCDGAGPFPPESIPQHHLFQTAVQELRSDNLQRKFQTQMAREIHDCIRKASNAIDSAGNETTKLIATAYEDIAKSLLNAMTKDGTVTPLQNPKLAEKQMDMLIDEAPMTIKASMKISKGIRSLLSAGANAVVPKAFRRLFENATSMLRREGVELDSEKVARSMAKRSSFARVMGPNRKNRELADWLSETFKDFIAEFDCEIEYLRPLVREHYESMNLWGKVKAHGAALATIALLIAAAVFAPIDGGGSLWGVSMLEGFLIAGGATGADLLQAGFNIRSAEKPLVEGQLSYLTASVASRAGLPKLETLPQPIRVQKEKIVYELQSSIGSRAAGRIRIAPFGTDKEFLQHILDKLHHFQERSDPQPEGNC